jgi:hypothetical protein
MTFDPQIRAQWQERSARLLKRGFRVPTRLDDNPLFEKLDRSNDEPRPVLYPDIFPMRNWIPARVLSNKEIDRRYLKAMRPRFSLAVLLSALTPKFR